MTKLVLCICANMRGQHVDCESNESENAWDFCDKRKLTCRVDQAQRIHHSKHRLSSTFKWMVDPALRALIHPTTAMRQAGRGFWRIAMLKQKCRVDQAVRIHHSKHRLSFTSNSLVDPALRALIHPTSTGRKIMRAGDLDKYTSTNDHSSVRCTFNARPR